jgi:FkbM family methyltransferase
VRLPLQRIRNTSHRATEADLAACYRLLLGRAPDPAGYRAYRNLIRKARLSVDQLVRYFLVSTEFRRRLDKEYRWLNGEALEPVDLKLGYRIYVRSHDREVGGYIRDHGEYEPHVTAELMSCLRPDDVFVDVGASLGYYTVLAGRLVGPTGRIVACEPGPQNQTVLSTNVWANRLDNVEVYQVAVSDQSGFVLYSPATSNGSIFPFEGDVGSLTVFALVQTRPLDIVLKGFERVNVIKVDVEGAEGLVFRGAALTLKKYRPVLFFEFSPPALSSVSRMDAREVLGFLELLGYSFRLLDPAASSNVRLSPEDLLSIANGREIDHVDVRADPIA